MPNSGNGSISIIVFVKEWLRNCDISVYLYGGSANQAQVMQLRDHKISIFIDMLNKIDTYLFI